MASVKLYRLQLDQEVKDYEGGIIAMPDMRTKTMAPATLKRAVIHCLSNITSTDARPINEGVQNAIHALAKKIGGATKEIDLDLNEIELLKGGLPLAQGVPSVLLHMAKDMVASAEEIEYKPSLKDEVKAAEKLKKEKK